MITDDERREVARKLREPKESLLAYPADELIRLRRETGCPRGQDFYEHLADLIDSPTCEMAECSIDHGSCSWGMRCSRCGTEFEHEKPAYGWRYCPNCGAEVVNHGV